MYVHVCVYVCITQFVAGFPTEPAAEDVDRLTAHLHLSDGEVEALRCHLRQPSALEATGAHPWVQGTVARMSAGNWFLLQNDRVPIATGRGTRPGSSFADLVFALLLPRILRVRDTLRDACPSLSSWPSYPWDGEHTLAPCSASDRIEVHDVLWADDLAVPRICTGTADLPKAIAAETAALTDACGEHGLVLAYGPHKTAAVATVCGKDSRRVRHELYGRGACAGEIKVLREHTGYAVLPLVPAYKHLGVQQQPAGAISGEIRLRVGQAKAAFRDGRRKIYKSAGISVKRKAFLLQALVLSKLTQGAGSWPPLTRRDRQTFDTALWTFYRSILCVPHGGRQSITGLTCFALTGLPSSDTLLRKCRLQYLKQLVAAGPDVLWALIRADREYADTLLADLHWLFLWIRNTSRAPLPASSWPFWRTLIQQHPGTFKGWIRRAVALDQCRLHLLASLDGLYRAISRVALVPAVQRELACPELCIPCKRAFATRVAWSGHAARLHGYRCRAHLTAKGSTCLACGKQFANLHRLRRHLVSVPRCVQLWGAFTPGVSADEQEPAHALEPPVSVPGSFAQHPTDPAPDGCPALLLALRELDGCEESTVWSCIADFIEPVATLRATVSQWRDEFPASQWHHEIAENMLILLDPQISAEIFPEGKKAPKRRPEMLPVWTSPARLRFAAVGEPLSLSLQRPPPVDLSLSEPTSIPLRLARGLCTWAEDVCRVLADCVIAADSRYVEVDCPDIWKALPQARSWCEALGFECCDSGLRSPSE